MRPAASLEIRRTTRRAGDEPLHSPDDGEGGSASSSGGVSESPPVVEPRSRIPETRPLTAADNMHIHLIWTTNDPTRPPCPACAAPCVRRRGVSRLYDEELRGV